MIKNMIQEIINFLNTYIKAHGCTKMNKWVKFLEQIGWHSASEPPIVPDHHNWISVIAIVCDMDDNSTRATDATFNKDKGWVFPEFSKVLYWCYPPKED